VSTCVYLSHHSTSQLVSTSLQCCLTAADTRHARLRHGDDDDGDNNNNNYYNNDNDNYYN